MTFTSILFYEILQICLKGTFLEVYYTFPVNHLCCRVFTKMWTAFSESITIFPQKHGIIHLFSTRAIFSLELRFLTPWYAYVCAYQGVINVNFSESKLIQDIVQCLFCELSTHLARWFTLSNVDLEYFTFILCVIHIH